MKKVITFNHTQPLTPQIKPTQKIGKRELKRAEYEANLKEVVELNKRLKALLERIDKIEVKKGIKSDIVNDLNFINDKIEEFSFSSIKLDKKWL